MSLKVLKIIHQNMEKKNNLPEPILNSIKK